MPKPNQYKMTPQRKEAFDKLDIPSENRIILCLDGGGMRGILTIQLLKKLEEVAGIPCYDLFDMVAGSSTGGIIASLITTGNKAVEIEEKYVELVSKVFKKRFLGGRFTLSPAFSKRNYRRLLKENIKDITLENACRKHELDIMITAHDLTASEETFFSCFKQEDGTYYGTYKDVLLRSVMEATMSAPTYFHPFERFIDGGTTTFNNPSLAAFMEAVSYSHPDNNTKLSAYKIPDITLFSFGTGISRQFIKPEKTLKPSRYIPIFWLKWVMSQTGYDASAMQINSFRSPLMEDIIDYRRFQISLDSVSIKKLPNRNTSDLLKYGSPSLHELTDKMLNNIDMSDIKKMDMVKIIGEQMATYIMERGNGFQSDLVDSRNNDQLVSYFGDIERVKKQMSDPEWIDKFRT